MRCASISIGIVAYEDRHYRESEMRLRYAADDARAFHRYASLAWEGEEKHHIVLTDGQVTLDGLVAAFDQVVGAGEFDLFLVYLSGHGEQGDAGGGWFCLVDARPGQLSLGGADLDRLLRRVRAGRTLVIIDCCFAEAVSLGMTFFAALEGVKGRLLVASARREQRSWEDDELKRSVFSDVLLRALSTSSSIADAQGHVEVESALLPNLREQVPLAASARKRGYVQEPVTGGFTLTALKLPTVASRSLGRPLSTAETIRAGVRRVMIGVAVVGIVALCAIDLLIYHLAVNASGAIVVRPGLASTFSLQPVHFYAPVDTGAKLIDIDPTDDRFLVRLADGSAWGLRTHTDDQGLRTWLAQMEPAFKRVPGASVRILARGTPSAFRPDDDAAPIVETAFLAKLNGVSAFETGRALYPSPRATDVNCSIDPKQRMDFTLFSSAPEVFGRDATWFAATAPARAHDRATYLADFVKLAAYRAAHEDDDNRRASETSVFVTALAHVAATALEDQTTFQDLATALLLPLQGTWCGAYVSFAIALIGAPDVSREAEAHLWTLLRTYRRAEQRDVASAKQSFAAEALAALSGVRPLDPRHLDSLVSLIEADGTTLDTPTLAVRLLNQLARVQALPDSMVRYLIETMQDPPKAEFDFAPLVAARILACNAHSLDESRRDTVRIWLERNAQNHWTMSDIQEALGCAALIFRLTEENVQILARRLSPASRFPPHAMNYRGEIVIQSNGDVAAVALGKLAQTQPLEEKLLRQLASIAEARKELPERIEILKGLATQRYGKNGSLADAIYAHLLASGFDAEQRNLEVEIAATRLAELSTLAEEATIAMLLDFWRSESEPHVRIALAQAIGTVPAIRILQRRHRP